MTAISSQPITLYYVPMSSASRVHWALEELGVPYEKVKLDLSKGEHRTPAYLAMNPNGKVPTMKIGERAIFESHAMLLWLGETFGVEKGLWPAAGTLERAEALQWIVWSCVTLNEALSRVFRQVSPRTPEDEKNPKALEAAKKDFAHHLGILEQRLADREVVVGDRFTLADLSLAGYASVAARFGIELPPRVAAYVARATSRPAYQRMQQG